MKKIWNYVSVKGRAFFTTKQMISAVTIAVGLFHVGLLLLFVWSKVLPLVLVNIASIIIYILCYEYVRKEKSLLVVFNTMYMEILIHSVVATILMGSESGFMLYMVAILPLGYYASYSLSSEKKYINPMQYVIVTALSFFVTKVLCRFVGPYYEYGNYLVERFMYIINYFIVVIAVVAFCSTVLRQVLYLEEQHLVQNRKLEELSKIDPLTGLTNRRSVQEKYGAVKNITEEYSLILGDIDDFKKVNDTYGHNVGDLVLKEVANVFSSSVREGDIVCRWGGEEILVCLPKQSKEQAVFVAERILNKVREVQVVTDNGKSLKVTMTLGVSVSNEAEDFKATVKMADDRLYKGKTAGKNRIVSD